MNVILTADADGKVKIWHTSTSSCLGTLSEAPKQILACAYNSSGDRFVTAGSDTKLNVYDERTKQVICTLQPRYRNVLLCDFILLHRKTFSQTQVDMYNPAVKATN